MRAAAVCLVALLVALLTGCGGADEPAPEETAGDETTTEVASSDSVAENDEAATPEPQPQPLETSTAPLAPRDQAAAAMEALFAACRDDDLQTAATHIVYRGPDRGRQWRSAYDMTATDEARAVQQLCRRIAGLLSHSSSYTKTEYETGRESEGVWHVWHVVFDTSRGPVEQIFAFLEVDGAYLLGDID